MKKIKIKLSSKNFWEPRTFVFTQLEAMYKLSIDYRSLWIITTGSRNEEEEKKETQNQWKLIFCNLVF